MAGLIYIIVSATEFLDSVLIIAHIHSRGLISSLEVENQFFQAFILLWIYWFWILRIHKS